MKLKRERERKKRERRERNKSSKEKIKIKNELEGSSHIGQEDEKRKVKDSKGLKYGVEKPLPSKANV